MEPAMKKNVFKKSLLALGVVTSIAGCRAFLAPSTNNDVRLPFMKNSANECYYLDEFMPVPDGLVNGKTGSLNLRYYTYNAASYKDLRSVQLNLAFYSLDNRCWSLFEEYYSKDF